MNKDKLRHSLLSLQDRLQNRQRSIQIDALKSESGRFAARAPSHLAEQASDEQELDMMASRLTASSEALAEIQDALDRLDEGKFNLCEECGGEIGLRRLEIQPWSRLCVACQRKLEEEPS
ncbi:MAG: TraR/DksA family transcriptional regulator [Planctomycetota bacterium]|nr:TraR/DksA family transcriptional regulator [Planctomycetota bacterium]